MKKTALGILILGLFLLAGCAGHSPTSQAMSAPQVSQPVIAPKKPMSVGSLWTTSQGSMFYDVKGREVGDIVTVNIYEKASATKEAKTSTDRDFSTSADISGLFGLEKSIANRNAKLDPTALLGAKYTNGFEGNGKTSRKEDLIATLTTQVIEVLPNGNLRIEGGKTVTVNNEDQLIMLSGIVRSADISPLNVVDSMHILNAQIAYTGKGIISDKQKPGWMVRVLDNVWPF